MPRKWGAAKIGVFGCGIGLCAISQPYRKILPVSLHFQKKGLLFWPFFWRVRGWTSIWDLGFGAPLPTCQSPLPSLNYRARVYLGVLGGGAFVVDLFIILLVFSSFPNSLQSLSVFLVFFFRRFPLRQVYLQSKKYSSESMDSASIHCRRISKGMLLIHYLFSRNYNPTALARFQWIFPSVSSVHIFKLIHGWNPGHHHLYGLFVLDGISCYAFRFTGRSSKCHTKFKKTQNNFNTHNSNFRGISGIWQRCVKLA